MKEHKNFVNTIHLKIIENYENHVQNDKEQESTIKETN